MSSKPYFTWWCSKGIEPFTPISFSRASRTPSVAALGGGRGVAFALAAGIAAGVAGIGVEDELDPTAAERVELKETAADHVASGVGNAAAPSVEPT